MLVKESSKCALAWSPKALALFASNARHTQWSALQVRFSKSWKRFFCSFLYFSKKKKKNQNWIKTLGSWHYWFKPLIWHIFSVTYLSKRHISLSVTCPKTHNPLVLLYFFPSEYLLHTNYHSFMSLYS